MRHDDLIYKWQHDPWVSERITDTGRREAAFALELESMALDALHSSGDSRLCAELLRQSGVQKKTALAADKDHDLAAMAEAYRRLDENNALEGNVVALAGKK